MSDLREQLRSAKAEYDALRYPGDLAGETLRHLHRPRRCVLGASLTALAAAVIATLLWMQRPATQVDPTLASAPDGSGVATTSPTQFTFSPIDRPAWPQRPDSRDAFPARQGISFPSVPSIPSWDALRESSLSNEQESI